MEANPDGTVGHGLRRRTTPGGIRIVLDRRPTLMEVQRSESVGGSR